MKCCKVRLSLVQFPIDFHIYYFLFLYETCWWSICYHKGFLNVEENIIITALLWLSWLSSECVSLDVTSFPSPVSRLFFLIYSQRKQIEIQMMWNDIILGALLNTYTVSSWFGRYQKRDLCWCNSVNLLGPGLLGFYGHTKLKISSLFRDDQIGWALNFD